MEQSYEKFDIWNFLSQMISVCICKFHGMKVKYLVADKWIKFGQKFLCKMHPCAAFYKNNFKQNHKYFMSLEWSLTCKIYITISINVSM